MVFLLKHGQFSNCQKSIDWLESGLVLIELFANYYYILYPGKYTVNEISPKCFCMFPKFAMNELTISLFWVDPMRKIISIMDS